MPYLPPHLRGVSVPVAAAAAVVTPVATPKPTEAAAPSSYMPPSLRKANPLAPENFPSLARVGSTLAAQDQPSPKPQMNFAQRIAESEAERARQEARLSNCNPERIKFLTDTQLIREGWAILRMNRGAMTGVMEKVNATAALAPEPLYRDMPSDPSRLDELPHYVEYINSIVDDSETETESLESQSVCDEEDP